MPDNVGPVLPASASVKEEERTPHRPVDRRTLLTAAFAVVAGGIAAAFPAKAHAVLGDAVQVGYTASADLETPIVKAQNDGSGSAVRGDNTSDVSAAVSGQNLGTGQGVFGVSQAGNGVEGYTLGGTGVYGSSETRDGVQGEAKTTGFNGVSGINPQWNGVYGAGRNGVVGAGDAVGVTAITNEQMGVALVAENKKNGFALKVVGRTRFNRSGLAATIVGSAYQTVTVPGGINSSSKFMVTMQGNPGSGVFITYAKYYTYTSFRVYFNTPCTAVANLAWVVLD